MQQLRLAYAARGGEKEETDEGEVDQLLQWSRRLDSTPL